MSIRDSIWPVLASALLHGALAMFFFVGWNPESEQIIPKVPQYVQAKLVELKPKAQQAQPQQVQKVDLTKQRREQEEAERRARQRAEQQKQAEREKQAEAERKRKEEQVRREAEQERQRQAERERQAQERQQAEQEQQQRQAELEKALQEELGMVTEDLYATEAQSYTQAIRQRIEQNWSRPPSARRDMEAVLSIQLVPTGRVVNVSVVKSSGDAAFDRSAEQAVQQVEVFPEVKDMPSEVFERYYRRFNLLFKPQDLRQ